MRVPGWNGSVPVWGVTNVCLAVWPQNLGFLISICRFFFGMSFPLESDFLGVCFVLAISTKQLKNVEKFKYAPYCKENLKPWLSTVNQGDYHAVMSNNPLVKCGEKHDKFKRGTVKLTACCVNSVETSYYNVQYSTLIACRQCQDLI